MTPRRFCEQIGICGGSGVSLGRANATDLAVGVNGGAIPAVGVNGGVNPAVDVLRMSVTPSIANNIECELCQYAAQTISPYFTPSAAESIVDYLNSSICQKY